MTPLPEYLPTLIAGLAEAVAHGQRMMEAEELAITDPEALVAAAEAAPEIRKRLGRKRKDPK